MAFTALVMLQFVRVYMVRMSYNISLFSNLYLWLALAASLSLQLLVIYTPLNQVFETVPLGWREWGEILVMCGAAFIVGTIASVAIRFLTGERD